MADMLADDFTLLQMHLLKLVGLIDRGRKQRLLHQQQVVVGFDSDNSIHDVFQMSAAGYSRPCSDPITLTSMLVRCEAGDQPSLLIKDSAAIQYRTRQLGAQHVAAR